MSLIVYDCLSKFHVPILATARSGPVPSSAWCSASGNRSSIHEWQRGISRRNRRGNLA